MNGIYLPLTFLFAILLVCRKHLRSVSSNGRLPILGVRGKKRVIVPSDRFQSTISVSSWSSLKEELVFPEPCVQDEFTPVVARGSWSGPKATGTGLECWVVIKGGGSERGRPGVWTFRRDGEGIGLERLRRSHREPCRRNGHHS